MELISRSDISYSAKLFRTKTLFILVLKLEQNNKNKILQLIQQKSNKMGFSLKIKSKDGQHILSELTVDSTIGVLKNKISELTKIPENTLTIKLGRNFFC